MRQSTSTHNIHSTAIVDSDAMIHREAEVGPYCIVGPRVTIGAGTRLISHVCVSGNTTIGEGNTIWPQATLGGDPQDLKFEGHETELIIGDHNHIRENVTCHTGTVNGGGVTRVGNHNLLMVNSHVAHDCAVGNHCILSNNVMLAGHIHMQDHAIISGGAAITHFVTIGEYAFIGGLAGVVHDCPPYMISDSHPARVRGVNIVGLKRHHFDEDTIDRLKTAYRAMFRQAGQDKDDKLSGDSISQSLDKIEAELGFDPCIQKLVAFMKDSALGVHGRVLERKRRDNKWTSPNQ